MLFSAPKGTRDILPSEVSGWQRAERMFSEVCSEFGYREIRIPTFENTEVFTRGVGDSTDVVRKEMYTFDDKGGRSMTLRPEGTAGVVRSYIENGMSSLPTPVRLYYMINAFRYEKMQKGRYREFHQFGVEAFGASGPEIDAEIISLLELFFERMGIQKTRLCINSIGCPDCRTAYYEELRNYFSDKLSDMCPDCNERYQQNPMRILDCKEKRCGAYISSAPRQLDYLCPECKEHFDGLKKALDSLGITYTVDTGIVRGLDYYTRTVFEFVSDHVGTQGTICGGGRYDKLVEMMGGPVVPGVGFAMGVERFLMETQAQGVILPEEQSVKVYIANLSEETRSDCQQLAYRMRRGGIGCETDLVGRSFRAQMKYANKSKIPFVAVIGKDEISAGTFELKKMSDGTLKKFSMSGDMKDLSEYTSENNRRE
ncbi:MAG: histidine--tRNA ligase [Clostridiales bacterium]|nr:histidine--tRNA ligase [Clostridiales bacterium]